MQDECAAPCVEALEIRQPEDKASAFSPHPVNTPAITSVTSKASTASANVSARLTAPMPGVVTMLEKHHGDEVQKGDVVLILEAMKMENLITSPVPGKVVSILCREGQRVSKGTLLALIS